jgi:hypothetical protein
VALLSQGPPGRFQSATFRQLMEEKAEGDVATCLEPRLAEIATTLHDLHQAATVASLMEFHTLLSTLDACQLFELGWSLPIPDQTMRRFIKRIGRSGINMDSLQWPRMVRPHEWD